VKNSGKPLTVAYSGGTAFQLPNTCRISTSTSLPAQDGCGGGRRRRHHPDVEPFEFDKRGVEVRMIRAARPARRIRSSSAATGRRYFKVTDECAQLARFKLMGLPRRIGAESAFATGAI